MLMRNLNDDDDEEEGDLSFVTMDRCDERSQSLPHWRL
jgi:hypothetical protein